MLVAPVLVARVVVAEVVVVVPDVVVIAPVLVARVVVAVVVVLDVRVGAVTRTGRSVRTRFAVETVARGTLARVVTTTGSRVGFARLV